jgi:hypothetical protein
MEPGLNRIIVLVLLSLAAVFAVGCEQPSAIELKRDEQESALEVVPVKVKDSLLAVASVDTGAVLPDDEVTYGGRFLINRVTLDGGPGYVASFAYASVLVSDSSIRFASRFVGYSGVNLGIVTLNGSPMVEVPHRVRVRFLAAPDTVLTRGVEYLADLSSSFVPNRQYTWTSTSLRFGRFDVSIQSPDLLAIQSPRGGVSYSREKDLLLLWTGTNGKLRIIVSAFDRPTRRVLPLVELRPKVNTGKALIPSSFLKQLPRHSEYVFSFILANRREEAILQIPSGSVLVQAASVYNCYLLLP